VFGSGNINAELVFVGEAPGSDEDEQGLPFVGRPDSADKDHRYRRSGTHHARRCVHLQYSEVSGLRTTETLNRMRLPPAIHSSKRQLAVIRPKVVCCLGTFAAQNLLQSQTTISKLRGQFFDVDGMRVIATFHPAYLLRSPEKKRDVWHDMIMIGEELRRLSSQT
jgi:DNA polymerase